MIVFGIGPNDDLATLINFRDQMGLTFPILFDQNGTVHEQYSQLTQVPSAFPEDWIIGADGKVAYVNNIFDVDAMVAIIESELD